MSIERLVLAAVSILAVIVLTLVGFHELSVRATDRARNDLEADAGSVADRLSAVVSSARATAVQVAADPQLASALRQMHDIPKTAADAHAVNIYSADGRLRFGRAQPSVLAGSAVVEVGRRVVGRVVVPVQIASVERGLPPHIHLALLSAPSTVATLPAGKAVRVRGALAQTLASTNDVYAVREEAGAAALVVWAPRGISATSALAKSLVFTAALGIVSTLVLTRPRRRPRSADGVSAEAFQLFGEALAAAHESNALLESFLRIAVETTGAPAGAVRVDDVIVHRIGPDQRYDFRLPLPVRGSSTSPELVLATPREGFRQNAIVEVSALAPRVSAALTTLHLNELTRERASTDDLTSLANRRTLVARLAADVADANLNRAPLSVITADLDGFKAINDRFGHDAGDQALRQFAGILVFHTREVDLAARVGGDEFVLVLSQTELQGAAVLAERIRRATQDARLVARNGDVFGLTASFGVASLNDPSDTSDALLADSDAALYQAKAAGRNRTATAQFEE